MSGHSVLIRKTKRKPRLLGLILHWEQLTKVERTRVLKLQRPTVGVHLRLPVEKPRRIRRRARLRMSAPKPTFLELEQHWKNLQPLLRIHGPPGVQRLPKKTKRKARKGQGKKLPRYPPYHLLRPRRSLPTMIGVPSIRKRTRRRVKMPARRNTSRSLW